MLSYGTVCSGIEAPSVAWGPLGMQPQFFCEIEEFPSRVLAARFPHVPNLGDFTALDVASLPHIDVLTGGTPCQAFSIAGKRLSLADARGNLTLAFAVLAHEIQDKQIAAGQGGLTVLWENVPGVLTLNEDNAYGCFLGALVGGRDPIALPRGFERWPDHGMVAGPRGRAVWRVLDCQWFGLAQRRERVFLVADLGAGIDPVSVLLEPQGLPGDRPACVEERARSAARAARTPRPKSIWGALAAAFRASPEDGPAQRAAATLTASEGGLSKKDDIAGRVIATPLNDIAGVSHALNAKGSASGLMDASAETFIGQQIAHTLLGEGFDASEDGTGRGTPLVPVPRGMAEVAGTMPAAGGTERKHGHAWGQPEWGQGYAAPVPRTAHDVIAFSCKDDGRDVSVGVSPTMSAMGHGDTWANGGGQIAIAFDTTQITSAENRSNPRPGDPAPTLVRDMHAPPAVAFSLRGRDGESQAELDGEVVSALRAADGGSTRPFPAYNIYPASGQGADLEASSATISPAVTSVTHGSMTDRGTRIVEEWDVRRLTVVECERLQGFPDNWTLIEGDWRERRPHDRAETVAYLMNNHGFSHNEAHALADCPDGPRYKAIGNSMATRVVRWIGERIVANHPKTRPE